jgi:hypothetical protein
MLAAAPRHLPVLAFVAPELCVPCGGACCKTTPGAPSPEDFGAPDREAMVAAVTTALATGRWSLDWWEGEPRREEEALRHDVFFPRPALRGEEGSLLYPADPEGACTFLAARGCELVHNARPLECRALEPSPGGGSRCVEHAGSRRERAIEWWPYEDVIARARAAREAA